MRHLSLDFLPVFPSLASVSAPDVTWIVVLVVKWMTKWRDVSSTGHWYPLEGKTSQTFACHLKDVLCVSFLAFHRLSHRFSHRFFHRLFMTRSSCSSSYLRRCSHSIFTISFSLRVRSISLLMDSLVSRSVSSFSCCLLSYCEEEEGRPPLTQLSSFWHHNLSLKMTGGETPEAKSIFHSE